jgi:sodium/pantothenate symporter
METFTFTNLLVLLVYLAAMIWIGIYCRRYSTKLEGFFVGFRSLGPWFLGFTYFATYYSSSVMVGNSGVGYKTGIAWMFMAIPQVVLIPIGLLLFAAALMNTSRQLGVITVPDYLRVRYKSNFPSGFLAIIMVVFLVPYMVAVTKGGALTFQTLLGVSYNWGVVIIIGITLAYTVVGGFMSGVITDMVQGIIMTVGAVVVFIVALVVAGGPTGVADKLNAIDPKLITAPGALGWTGLLGFSFVFGIAPWGLPQLLQKTFAMKNRRVVGPSAIIVILLAVFIMHTCNGIGVIARALYGNEFINNPDYAFPMTVVRLLPPFIDAFLLTAVVAAVMSTLDAVLLVAAGAVSRDLYQRVINSKASDESVLKVTWVVMIILSLVTMAFAFSPPPMLLYLTVFSFALLTSTILAPLFFGIYYRGGTLAGCVTSQILGVATVLIFNIFKIKFLIHPLVPGLIVALIALPLVSRFTEPLPQEFVNRIFSKEFKQGKLAPVKE